VKALTDSRFLRFAIVGACGFLVDESVLAAMHYGVGLRYYISRAISIFCAMTFTWWGNRNLTFREHAAVGNARFQEWLRFVIANAFGAGVNYGVSLLLTNFAPTPANNPFLATAAGVAVGLVFNFTLSKRFVFKTSQTPE
jgi:putative flippase GtrA